MTDVNAFASPFLDMIHKRNFPLYPVSLESGRWHGPWTVTACEKGEKWQVVRDWRSAVEAVCELRETACMLAAI